MVGGDSITAESVAADATVRDAATRVIGADSITGESGAADATIWEGAAVWEGFIVDSNPDAGAGAGAFWVDANAEAAAGNGAFWDEDDSRSPTMALDLELDSDPIGSGEQPTNPATNVTSASSLPQRKSCDMASSTPSEHSWFLATRMAQIAAIEVARPRPILRAHPPRFRLQFCTFNPAKRRPATTRLDRYRCPATPSAARDHHGLTGPACSSWHASTQISPPSARSAKSAAPG